MKFSVVIPCYINREELLQLTKQAVPTFGECELIVIDDCSPMGGGYLRSIADIYIRNKENLGYAKSVNRGLKLATGNYIAVANNDIRVSPNWQSVAEEVFGKDEQCYSCHFRMTDYEVPFKYGHTTHYTGKERWCHASFFVINPAKVKVYYDENFFNTYDDWDYWKSVRSMGYKQAYTDKACFQHIHSATIPSMVGHDNRNKENAEFFKDKWGDYAEKLFEKEFPLQVGLPYADGFNIEP